MTTIEILPILQLSISPVILISAVGMLLLTMNNRHANSLTRARQLLMESEKSTEDLTHTFHDDEVEAIFRRAKLQRSAITYAAVSALCAAILVITLFVSTLFHMNIAWFYAGCFIAALLSLVISLIYFVREVRDSLDAFSLTLKKHKERFPRS